jgi:hypothetical protein
LPRFLGAYYIDPRPSTERSVSSKCSSAWSTAHDRNLEQALVRVVTPGGQALGGKDGIKRVYLVIPPNRATAR